MSGDMIKPYGAQYWLTTIGVVVTVVLARFIESALVSLGVFLAVFALLSIGVALLNASWRRMLAHSIDAKEGARRMLVVLVGECVVLVAFTLVAVFVLSPVAASIPAIWLLITSNDTRRIYREYRRESPGVFVEFKGTTGVP